MAIRSAVCRRDKDSTIIKTGMHGNAMMSGSLGFGIIAGVMINKIDMN